MGRERIAGGITDCLGMIIKGIGTWDIKWVLFIIRFIFDCEDNLYVIMGNGVYFFFVVGCDVPGGGLMDDGTTSWNINRWEFFYHIDLLKVIRYFCDWDMYIDVWMQMSW